MKNYTYDHGDKISACIKNNKKIEEQQNIINKIILWKINRQAEPKVSVLEKLVHVHEIQLNDLCTNKKETEDRVKDLLISLIETKGIRLPMASTILHFIILRHFLLLIKGLIENFMKKKLQDLLKRIHVIFM